ncbi:MAG: undecaprenyldiphospho-muramoylpentapeptide beta-N-acetylglucosaminyltransferase [Spirochaetaceae bacterium]|nr:undecaprenyldiphospho-muramoylpentapeptide beta-N-acetylglucosaminyltransferase [Spirochaetaceae bacterium]
MNGRGSKAAAMDNTLTIAFTGGGTGGHIYPGLALIEALRTEGGIFADARIIWLGSKRGMDKTIVESAAGLNIAFFGIRSGKLRRSFSFRNILDIYNVFAGFIESLLILKRERPRLLFSKGGFVSVPPVAAAHSLKIPAWTHESDFSMGLANKINARFAVRIFLSYEQTLDALPPRLRGKAVVSGNPVRAAFYSASSDERVPESAAKARAFLGLTEDAPVLFILGGSQGAQEINALVEQTLAALTVRFVVVHQTGGGEAAGAATDRYKPFAYIKNEMPSLLAYSALVAGRSGAGTVWECAACGKPMMLIPLAGSGTRGDQVENARYFERKGAAVCLVHPSAGEFLSAVTALADSPARLKDMAESSHKLGRQNAAAFLAREICDACLAG